MAGGLIQLMSYGYADKPLIFDPEITFFKVIYYKHSLFSIQEQQLSSENDIHFSSSTTYKIRHNGDLFFRPMLEINLPSITLEYEKTLDEYIENYNSIEKRTNLDINFITSNLNTILYNYDPYKFPIYIKDNLIINSYFDYINSVNIETSYTKLYNTEYSSIIDNVSTDATNYQEYINNLTLYAKPTLENARYLFYSSFNINYLSTFLNKKTYSDDFIIIDDDYNQLFQYNLFNYITSNNYELSFLYSVINNKNIVNNNFITNNTNSIITNIINYKLQYLFQNMNILYIYENIENDYKQLKSIVININSIFTNNSYSNNIIPFTNLYDQFETDISNNYIFHIASGYDLDKKFNITKINTIDISNNSYDINFNVSNVNLNSNIIYFIFSDKKPSDQDISGSNSNSSNYEDYFDLYYNQFTSYNTNIYDTNNLLLPICVLKYNDETELFDKIELSSLINDTDYVFIYNDVFIFNTLKQKNEFILINDYMYTISDISSNTSNQYSTLIYIDNPQIIENNTINLNDGLENIIYYLNSNGNILNFIDQTESYNYKTFNFISPYQILYNIDSTNFNNNRLKQINYKKDINLNLDIYNNLIYNQNKLQNINVLNKNTYILENLKLTIPENITYIKNLFNYFLNDYCFFKEWNSFTYDNQTETSKMILSISPTFGTNYYSNIFTNYINGENYFYNQFQDLIKTNIDNFIDNFELDYTEIIRYISNLDNSKKLADTLLNITNLPSYITISEQPLGSYFSIENEIKKSSIYFKINSNYLNIDISFINILETFGCSIQQINGYYCIKNIVYNNDAPKPIYLLPYNFICNKQFYFLMFLLNYPKKNNQAIINEFYLTPNDTDYSTSTIPESNKVNFIYYTKDTTNKDNLISGKDISNNNITYLFDCINQNTTINYDFSNIEPSHYLLNLSNKTINNINPIVDINNILYDYSYKLYINIRDIVSSEINSLLNNKFAIYVDFMTFNNLWHLKQNITKKTNNGNNAGIINLYNQIPTSLFYLDCNINFSSIIDHVIINNSITNLINDYLITYIKPKMINIINHIKSEETDKFINIIYNNNIDELNININIETLTAIKLIYVYLNILNTIKLDIEDTDIIDNNLKFEYLLDDFNYIKDYFAISSNIFSGTTYNGKKSYFDLSYNYYLTIKDINNDINDIINFVIKLLDLKDIIREDNSINIYTKESIYTVNNNIIFRTLNLNELLYNLPLYFCNNFYKNYEYPIILNFFNKVKLNYIHTYKLIFLDIYNSGIFSYNFYSNLKQYINFSIDDYEKNLNFYKKNLNYTENTDIIQILKNPNNQINTLTRETFYKYSIVNNIDTSLSYINTYYNRTYSNYDDTYNFFINNKNILNINYTDIDTIISNFNTFFGFTNSFYSDNRLCSTLYFYLYNEFTVNTYNNEFNIFFNSSDNTSSLNYMINNESKIMYYNFVGFVNNSNNIKYILQNNKLVELDISNNVLIFLPTNYEYKYDSNNLDDILYTWDKNNQLTIKGNDIYDISNNKLYNIKNNYIYKYVVKDLIGLHYFFNFDENINNTGSFTNNGNISNGDSNTFSTINNFNSINLNGTNQFVTIPGFKFTIDGYSISFWGKFNVPNDQSKTVMIFIDDNNDGNYIQVTLFQGYNLYVSYFENNTYMYSETFNQEQNGDNTWRFYTYTISYTNSNTGTMKAYVNNQIKWIQNKTSYLNPNTTFTLYIGKNPNNNIYTNMSLSQLSIQNAVLSDSNIEYIYNNLFIKPPNYPNPTIQEFIIPTNAKSIGYIDKNIYDISGIKYKYDVLVNNTKILFINYRQVESISKIYNTNTNNYNTTFNIDNNIYTTIHNFFYDASHNLQYILYLPDTNLSDMTNFKLLEMLNNESYDIIPKKIKKEISVIDTDIDLSNIFKDTFNINYAQKTIDYLNKDIQLNIIDNTEKINNKLFFLLLNNIFPNSIMSNQYNNQDIYICSSFNNYIHNNLSYLNNINNILSWLQNYNNTSTNEIKIFYQKDQTIHTISEFINNNFSDISFNFVNFVPEFYYYFPINNLGQIVKPINLIEDINFSNTSHFEYMLKQSKNLKMIPNTLNMSTYLTGINNISTLIKKYIITQIYTDISDNTNIISQSNIHFILKNNNTIDICTNNNININNSAYYIINTNLVTSLERYNIFDLSYNNYTIKYKNQKLYLSDINKNIDYLITTTLENNNIYEWDISKTNISSKTYYKFNNDLNTVLINVKNNISFPNTLFIYDGYLDRINRTSFGFNYDSSFNLVYNFKYDLSYSILSRVITKFNAQINTQNIFDISQSSLITETSCIVQNYSDLSNNYSLDIKNKYIYNNFDILDIDTIYIDISKNIDISLNKEYIILKNLSNSFVYHIKKIVDMSNSIIYSLEPVNINNKVQIGTNTLLFGIKDFINLLGLNYFDNNTVFYYWETFNSSLNNIINLLNTLKDDNFIDKNFTLNGYINTIYDKIIDTSKDQTLENNFFETPNIIFKKKISFGNNIFDSLDSIKSSLNNSILFYKSYKQSTSDLYNQLNRPIIPKCAWIPFIGHFLVDKINLKIDDNIIEEIDDQIIHNFNFSKSTVSKDIGLNKMIGNTPDLTMKQEIIPKKTLYVPLPFFFADKEKALPIVSMLNSQLSINLKIREITKLLKKPSGTKIKLLSKLKIKLNGSYVYLDTEERYKFAQMRHEYLIKTKKNIKYFINQNIGSLKLDLHLPCSEMFWFYLDQSIKDIHDYWNYTGIKYKEYYWNDVLMNDYDNNDDVNNFINTLSKNNIDKINWYRNKNNKIPLNLNYNLSVLDANQLYTLAYYLYGRTRNPNPFISSQLIFNGHKRFDVDGIMSTLVTSLTYYRDTFPSGLNVYTFCRYPKLIKHSGSLNFKYATNINFDYSLKFKDNHSANGEINIIICELNVLRIASGIGCVAW